MDDQKTIQELLNQLPQAAFQVKENTILTVNPAAQTLYLSPGDSVLPLLEDEGAEYLRFQSGALFLSMEIAGQRHTATVTRNEHADLFLLEPQESEDAFRIMELTSMELRKPMSALISSMTQLLEESEVTDQPRASEVNRNLMQLMRLVCNLSDAGRYQTVSHKETREIGAFLQEILDKAHTLSQDTNRSLRWELPREAIYCLIDPEQIERAVWNLLSNAMKFTPAGGAIQVTLIRTGRRLSLSVTDSGSGIAENILGSLFRRHQRTPGIEDSRFGLGLGMVIVRATAANHGGTVLVDQPDGAGTRITLSFPIRQITDTAVQSPLRYPDYSSGWDHALLELSECLPTSAYQELL